MSEYSGKCDVCDWFQDNEDKIKNTKFIIDGVEEKINSIKDLVPYYPCIIGIGTNNTVWFSSESYVDIQESAHYKYKLLDAKKAYKKTKRQKQDLTLDNVYNNWYHGFSENEIDREITERVIDDYEGADTRGLTTTGADYYRELLFNKMVEEGYTVSQAINRIYSHRKDWKCEY